MPEYDVYDKVWIMENNKPVEKEVCGAWTYATDDRKGRASIYYLMDPGDLPERNAPHKGESLFPTKETLVKSLLCP